MSFDASGKIEEFKFIVKRIKKYYESNNSYIKSNYPIVNEYGMPTIVKRFFEIYEVVNKMDDLMNCSITWNIGPKMALSRYANQYKHELKNTPLTLNQQLNNIKLNNIGLNSPLLSMSNSDSTFNQQNFNSLLTMDMMPPPQQISSTSNSAHSSLNSTSETLSEALNKKRLAATTNVATTAALTPPSSNISAINVGTNSMAAVNSNSLLKLNSAMNPVSSSLGSLNLPASSSVLSSLATSNAAISAAGLALGTSTAAANSLMSAVNMNALSKANVNPTTAMKSPITNLISPLQMELSNEPKSKKLKTNPSPRQRKSKANSRTTASKNRRNSSNNSSTISS
ncbi:hypothetical protein LY90DRAFT_502016 [Neocallimastix californiae]|uniref:Uncharacterized protein n=1 Tax=Neocallimastix californiae TaxID=1754190 RepID=A0A1Y2EXD3_9FUNG|nr:hypothetical protein LY90DRAFT_502016 [Neocallimastix californiae]|eukprot:ORY75904.1 hypothetical protein LY90DRAFT_502016 [Neocallimastix californiae]